MSNPTEESEITMSRCANMPLRIHLSGKVKTMSVCGELVSITIENLTSMDTTYKKW